jgi:FtsP/CotA-like multicopper oxidase with cupredoxin domain
MSNLKPLPAQTDSVLINSGPLPLVHLFDQGGRIRILNATTKQTLLDANVPAGSIISVSDSGILVGRQRRLTTSLNPRHRYEIWWDVAK